MITTSAKLVCGLTANMLATAPNASTVVSTTNSIIRCKLNHEGFTGCIFISVVPDIAALSGKVLGDFGSPKNSDHLIFRHAGVNCVETIFSEHLFPFNYATITTEIHKVSVAAGGSPRVVQCGESIDFILTFWLPHAC